MDENKISKLKKQAEFLKNNTGTLEIPKNYLMGVKEKVTAITELVSEVEEQTNYALKGIDMAKEGFVTVSNDITEIINAEN